MTKPWLLGNVALPTLQWVSGAGCEGPSSLCALNCKSKPSCWGLCQTQVLDAVWGFHCSDNEYSEFSRHRLDWVPEISEGPREHTHRNILSDSYEKSWTTDKAEISKGDIIILVETWPQGHLHLVAEPKSDYEQWALFQDQDKAKWSIKQTNVSYLVVYEIRMSFLSFLCSLITDSLVTCPVKHPRD